MFVNWVIYCHNNELRHRRLYLENDKGRFVPATVTLRTCNLLAEDEFASLSPEKRIGYNDALLSGEIIMVSNGTEIQKGESLNFEKNSLYSLAEYWSNNRCRRGPTSHRRIYVGGSGGRSAPGQESLRFGLP
jgi:hypothetical protein